MEIPPSRRRSTKYSALHVVVMKKSAARKRSERQGTLVEVEAVRRAEAASAADAEKRTGQQKKLRNVRRRKTRSTSPRLLG